ncbi:MAG TPA: sigma factor SigB regulation protein RsbQ [Hydrogenophaga sp.]|uniref:alpha/beta fold hydrolase n=1 Tax=Hydrogenophaga sp. TaxID=1904254 RepID=UPI0008AB3F72|nr:alpha/beta hydrolase [Hydrogenophaga sp.]OGA73652.1 MAG: sigma factor SigB regulation protein RsbQ [Burkholderiales bacterium GWE1_65_30]OGA92146.1 MAG: sigma factor SigB regulation protein RsbQ [Burkholderiales bacterium GWF1_66_17]HAX23187.1 sigma factor SigB regulation protein RsbQ [Hydrogenophaga sp.]HBU17540.1 sigma factor SigB regulation protein RsbQ [Hydrogenophaga sp.]
MNVNKRNNVNTLGDRGSTILFAHGLGCSQSVWSRITPAFAGTHRQVLFDFVGSGKSQLSAFSAVRYRGLDGYAQDVLDVCEAQGLQSGVTFVGHSASCNVGLLASIARPNLFDRLILVGPTPCFLNYPPEYAGGFERADLQGLLSLMDQNYIGWANYLSSVVAGTAQGEALAGELSDSFCSTNPVAMRVFAQTTFFADNRADLPQVSRPCLILQHQEDSLVPLAVGEYLNQQLKGSTLEVMNVAGHAAHMSHPALVIDAMRRYMAKEHA